MRGSSLNFKLSKKGSLEHNDRTEESEVEYLLSDEFRLGNEFDFSAVEAKKNIKYLLVEANNHHLQTVGQKLQSKSYLWEAVINLDAHHTLKDLNKLVRKLEKLTGFTSVQATIHRDEGHEGKDKDGNHIVIYNYHAHVTFFTLDRKKGLQLYRKDISKPLRREYREKVEEYRIVHKRLIPPYCSNNIIKLKKKPKWSEVNMLEINKEIRRRFKSDGHIVYDKERLSYLQTIVAEELKMPRGTVSVEAEAKRLGVVLDFEPSVRREHKQLRAQKRAEEKIEKKLTEENDISEQAHIETKIDLQNNFDYFISLFFALVSENESIKKQLDDMQKELVEQNKIIPKENEVAIGRKLYEEIEKIQDKFSHLDPEGLYEKILLSEDDYTRDISTLEIKVKELNKNVYSEHDQNVNGKSTGKKLTNKELVSILENDTTKQKKQIEKLEDALVEFEIEQKEKIEAKDNETLSLNQQIRELKKDVLSEDWTQTDNNGNKHKSKNIDVVKYLEKKRTELKEKIGELETENNILTTTLEQKETQIASDSTTLKDSQEKIKVLEKQVQELKDKEPEIIEVIKEVSIELTPEEIMQLVIETEHGSMKIEDVIEKQKEEISNQKESINSIYGEIYHDDGIDKPVSYKNLWEKEKNKLVTEKPYKTSEADQKEIDKLKNLLVLELEKKPKEQPEEMVMAEVPNEQGEIEHKEVTIKLYNSILEAKINQIRDDVSFWKRIATKYLLSLEIDIDQSREYIEKEVDNKLWEKLSTSEKVLKLEELARQWQITYDSGEATDDNDVFMKKGDKIKGDLVVERAKLSNEQKRTKNKKTLTGVNEGMGENLKTVKIKKTQGNSSNRL